MIEILNIFDENFTFNELNHLNISSQEILQWSSSIDLAEQYQYYLDQPIESNLLNKIFYNCTSPWFGSSCQYSLELNENIFPQTCYILLECDRELLCRPDLGQFSCGNGQCVEDFHECDNNRHLTLIQSISVQKNLSYSCWIGLVCLSKIMNEIDNISCDYLIESSKIIEQFQNCDFPLEFPVVPVLFGHVRFLYHPKIINRTLALKPDYICYDERLCDFLQPTFRYKNLTCQYANQTDLGLYDELFTWKSIIDTIKPYFIGCITKHYENISSTYYSSLYQCKNSSKYISKYRILDGISDCFLKDDEQEFELSCLLNQTFRFQCLNEKQCYSPILSREICSNSFIPINSNEILFYQICDRIRDLPLILINGKYHSDETDCEYWQCNNIYTRCDGFQHCFNREDEKNCTTTIRLNHFLFCISPQNYTFMCLPAEQISNKTVDCLRILFDEDEILSMNNISWEIYQFRYWNYTKCQENDNNCKKSEECLLYNNYQICIDYSQLYNDYDLNEFFDIQNILCQIINRDYIDFSLDTALVYPSLQNNRIISVKNQFEHEINELFIENLTQFNKCNYGLYVHYRHGVDDLCFCSPNYYGDRCQYQNQRVSLTLVLATFHQPIIYTIVVTLIEDDNDRQEIQSYHQFNYESGRFCGKPLDIYLLYGNQGKNISKNYHIHIDLYEKNSLTYFLSWYLKIPFLFLPVNRITAYLTLPISRIINNSNIKCTLRCLNGICIKYHNEKKFFCQCYSGWSGAQCHIPIDCSMCASNSICIGSIQNQSICICPKNTFGSFCRLKLTCPKEFCQNNGQCIIINEGMTNESFLCLCSEQFFGSKCENIYNRIEISFKNIDIPSYLIVYIYNTISFDQSKPTLTILKKMHMFQNDIILYTIFTFQMIFVEIDANYYLAALQKFESSNITTLVSSIQRCPLINELFSTKILSMPRIQRIKSYHLPCQHNFNLQCFIDEFYMCLCTKEHQSNCFLLNHQLNLSCEDNVYCENNGICLQDRPTCFYSILCSCNDCFFGDRCQFYAKGIGLTLDDLLRYEIRPYITFNDQSLVIKISAIFVMILFLIERRVWCLIRYSQSVERYTTIIQYFHFLVPLLVNLISACFIIIYITRVKMIIRTQFSYKQQLLKQINEHKQIVISPILLVILLFPRFLVSLLSKCVKSSRNPWLYLCGYFISFIPSSFIFIIFVLPSTFYRRQFKESITTWAQRLKKIVK
ncbi:hypothetical protein I4U23_005233 [Adineta vaga]|nr:hypothetical protein I4U23_005233 [Adineta vaga]